MEAPEKCKSITVQYKDGTTAVFKNPSNIEEMEDAYEFEAEIEGEKYAEEPVSIITIMRNEVRTIWFNK